MVNFRRVLLGCAFVVGLVALWVGVYKWKLSDLDKDIDRMGMADGYLDEADSFIIGKVVTELPDGRRFDTIQDMVGVVTEPCTATCVIEYSDGTILTKNCYVVFNTDESVEEAVYEDGIHGRIVLPVK